MAKKKKKKTYKVKLSGRPTKGKSMYKPLFNLSADLKEAVPKGRLSKIEKETLKRYKEQLIYEKQANREAAKEKAEIRKRLKKRHASEKTIKREQNKIFTYDLSLIKNKINRISRKPFYFIIQDGLQTYKIKSSTIKKHDNPGEIIIKTYIKELQKQIDKENRKPKKQRNLKKLKALNNMMESAKRHENVILGRTESFSKGEYPAIVTMFADIVDISL